MKMHTAKRGFTIVELVIVIAVIAILAAVLIPTFASLIKKANESVDIRLVREMNTILKADEAEKGKPAGVDAVRAILAENGIADFTPAMAEHAFAWDKEENVVVLINTTTVFPKEYKDVPYEASWELLAGNVEISMEDLGATLDEAIANAKPGQTIVLTSDQTLNATDPIEFADIDLGGHKLTLTNGLPMNAHSSVTLSNGDVESSQITLPAGAELTLNEVDLVASGCAIYPLTASHVNITGGSIMADVPIGTSYSSGESRFVDVTITGTTMGSESDPCSVGIMLITSGDIVLTDCTIYATEKCVYNRAGNVTIKNSTMNYQPTEDYKAVHLDTNGSGYDTPGGLKSLMWGGGSSGANAPIVVGDFHGNHYSADANCVLENVTINSTNATYPDVYLSQEKCDFIDNNAKPNLPIDVMKTTLTCDSTIEWVVNASNYEDIKAIVGDCSDYFVSKGLSDYTKYGGFEYSGSGYGGTVFMYVDNVFVNGVEQAPGSTSASPVPAN